MSKRRIFVSAMRDEIDRGGIALGLGVGYLPSSAMPLIAAEAGFSWLFIDLEHSALTSRDAAELCMSAIGCGVTPLVRLGRDEIHDGSRLLDNGAGGIVMPRVQNRGDAERLVSLCKYPPIGTRSWGGPSPHLGFPPAPASSLMSLANERSLAVAMVESISGLDRVEEIASTPGLNAIFVGAIDLSVELGLGGDVTAPSLVQAVSHCVSIALKHGLLVGLGGVFGTKALPLYTNMRFQFVLGGIDYRLLNEATRSRIALLREHWTSIGRTSDP